MKATVSRARWRSAGALVVCAAWLLGCVHGPAGPHYPTHLKPGAVIYGVVPPLFGQAPFKDVTARLDELRTMGVDVLWLSPINATDDPSGISYSITDYFAVRPDFGSLEDLRRLVAEAHRRGLRVIMDFVPNHTSTAHPFFQDIQEKGAESIYFDFYDRDASGEITHYFDWVGLPNLNYENPRVAACMARAFRFWMRTAGIDGFRVDVAWGIRERSPQVWPELIGRLREDDPDAVMVAEAGARDPYYIENGFDLAYDWTEELVQWAWHSVFENPERAGPLLHAAITRAQEAPHTVLRFLNNNDTGRRFISRHGPEITRVAAILLHTVPGVPLVYTGDEVGAEYEPYEDVPPLAWDDPHGLKALYRRLAELREALPALHSGAFISLPPRNNPAVYAFIRAAGPDDWVLVALNFGPAAQVALEPPAPYAGKIAATTVVDLLTGRPANLSADAAGRLLIRLEATESMLLAPVPQPAP